MASNYARAGQVPASCAGVVSDEAASSERLVTAKPFRVKPQAGPVNSASNFYMGCATILPGPTTMRNLIGRTLGHHRIVEKIGDPLDRSRPVR
jgi:hypothetical protein